MRKSIPYGLLAFAVSTSLLVAQEGWSAKPGSGLTYNGGDGFGVNWLNFVQVGWSFANNENAADTNSFDVGTARTQLRGHAFNKNITYRLQLDLAEGGGTLGEDAFGDPVINNDSILKDAYVQYNFSSSDDGRVGVRLGQGKTMFGLESTGWIHGLWFVDRSIASQAFAEARSRGAWLVGSLMEKEKPIRFAVGAMNTDASPVAAATFGGEEASNPDNELSYVAAVNWDIMGDFFGGEQTAEYWRQGDFRSGDTELKGTIGAGVALGNSQVPAGTQPDLESTTFNLNTAWTVNNINLLGEFYTRTDEIDGAGSAGETEPMGWAVSGGYLLEKSGDSAMQWGLGLRVAMVESDSSPFVSGVDADVTEISGVVNAFYHGHACKTQLQYTWQDVDPTSGGSSQNNHILSLLFQLTF
jgi:Phosphate-selective porin O and P